MKKIKVFTCSYEYLQQEIDYWIEHTKPLDIISVTPSLSQTNEYLKCITTVLYLEQPPELDF